MNAIIKSFKEARLRDVLIQLGTMAKGLRHSGLIGKMYNHGARCYKLMYEALYHFLIQQMETHHQNDP